MILFVVVLVGESVLQLWNKQFLVEKLSAVCIAACSTLVAKRIPHAMEVQSATKQEKSAEVTLIGFDLIRTVEMCAQLLQLFTSHTQLLCVLIVLLHVVGPPGLMGVAVCSIASVNGVMLSRAGQRSDKKILVHTDSRIGVLKQILEGV